MAGSTGSDATLADARKEDAELPAVHVAAIELSGRRYSILHSDPGDHIFRSIAESGRFYEDSLLRNLARRLRPHDVVIDAGANIGNHTVYFAAVAGCRVVAFEPNPAAARLLRRNAELNGVAEQVTVYEKALSDATGLARFDNSAALHNLGAVRVVADAAGEVETVTIDGFLPSVRPRLIKIDTEGYESAVLRGARSIIRRWRPAICAEIADPREYEQICDFLAGFGYVHVGSFNFTPTHVFVPFRWREVAAIWRSWAEQGGRAHVQAYVYHADLVRRMSRAKTVDGES
jgi:FkbM family methyltransferase